MKFKLLTEGIAYDGKNFRINPFENSSEDIIHIAEPYIEETKFDNKAYYFGYKFTENASSKVRSKFIHWIKFLEDNKPEEFIIEHLIALPLDELNKRVNLSTISCTLSPRSNRSPLVMLMRRCINNILPHNDKRSFELIKNLPQNISFNWKTFDDEYDGEIGDKRYQAIRNHIDNELMPKIKNLDYFSIAANVKPKYRRYIKDYLKFETEDKQSAFEAINGGNILIYDDINTSGATLREILRIVRVLAPDSKIFIFTLIGNMREGDSI